MIHSESVSFDLVSNRSRAARRRNFFAELLREGTALDNFTPKTRVFIDDTIALLAQFGPDIAGAIQIFDSETPGEPRTLALAPIEAADIGQMLTSTQAAPWGTGQTCGPQHSQHVDRRLR